MNLIFHVQRYKSDEIDDHAIQLFYQECSPDFIYAQKTEVLFCFLPP